MSQVDRERVVLAQRRGARRSRARMEVAEQTEVGDALIRGLIRAQLWLAIWLGLVPIVLLCTLPALFRTPWLAQADVAGLRLSWLVLGITAYPLLYAVARLYLRRADHNEREFLTLTED